MTTEIGELIERWRQNRKRKKISDVEAFELGKKERGIINREAESLEKPVYKVRPYRGEGGVREAITLLNGMHETAGKAETHAFEIVYDEEILDFRFVPGSGIIGKNLRDQLFEDYPDSTVEQLPEPFPSWDDDEYIAGSRMHFFKSTEYPIRHIDIDGFGDGNETSRSKESRDPFKNILTKVTGGSTDVLVQVVFRPSQQGFRYRGKMAKVAEQMRSPNTRFLTDYPATDVEEQAADIIENQQNESMYEIEIRVMAAASTNEAAEGRVHSVVHALDEFYESHNRQGFYGVPVGETTLKSSRSDMHSFLSASVSRSFEGYTNMKCTASELAGVVHLSGDVNNPHIDYSESRAGIPVPIGTPRFDFAQAGLDETATPLEKQVAMFNASAPGKPYWIGNGARKGTEAGIHEKVFKQHVFVPGATGYGKTTLLKNLFRQMMARDAGGMFYDPKGDDTDDVLSLVPEGREDDVIYIELGGNRDKQVGFNFLEVPSDEDPDSPAYKEAVEALADDLESLISLAGGEEDYWGPRMMRVVRNMVRGMAKAGYDCTLLDMYFALVSQERREQYAQMLEDERVDWIVEYAREHLADMDDSDLEPLVGRLQQWIENPITRELVSYPQSTFSVEEAVREGKIIIVGDKTSSETVGTMVATALIRRVWVAVREQSRLGTQPPMFYTILDEFDKIISSNSNIARILSLARSKNLSIIGACQDLSNQLQGKEQIQNAILGQCRTILNLNAQRPGEARLMAKRHSEDIDTQDLINLGNYQLYMRTNNEHGEPTKTYKVGTFPPIDDVDDVARTDAETEALIERSLEQYGGERRTSEDQKRDSTFYDYTPEDSEEYELTDEREALILKAAYDLALTDDECRDGFVSDDRVQDVAGEWMGFDDLQGAQFWGMVDYIPDSRLTRSESETGMQLKCTDEGRAYFLATGCSSTSGKGKHRELLKSAYDPMTLLGLDVRLPIQTGEEAADGLGRVPFETTVPLRDAERVREEIEAEYPILFELTGGGDVAFESESSTGETQPSQTLKNLGKAIEKGQKCLLLCRPKTADTLEGYLTDPPFMAKNGSFYNLTKPVRIDGGLIMRPEGMTESVWRKRNGQYVLEDQTGRVFARFDSHVDILTDASAYPPVEDDGDGGPIKAPYIPGEDWSSDDYEVVVVPEDAASPDDIWVRRDGMDIPLLALTDEQTSEEQPQEVAAFDEI